MPILVFYFSFTSAIRTGFKFEGDEYFQFGGGESLWVYISKQLVMYHVDLPPLDDITTCKAFQLSNVTGNVFLTLKLM